MPKGQLHKLTARFVDSAEPGTYSDGGNLFLVVEKPPSTSRRWAFVFTPPSGRRQREMGLGGARNVTLARARELAAECRAQLARGVDPIEARKAANAPPLPKFGTFADEWISTMEASWRSAVHRRQWRNSLKSYAGSLHDMTIDVIQTENILAVLTPIWQTKGETADRVRNRIERILDAAEAAGHRTGKNPARWKGHLDKLLPKPPQPGHFAALPFAEVPEFIGKLRQRPALAARAFEFAILTAARTGETLGAVWNEIDLDAKVWTVPASRMKGRREHRVPLSERAIQILDEAREAWGSAGFIFPGQRPGKPLSSMAFEMLLRRMGISNATAHGFRSSFRDWAGELTSYPREVAEAALAHAVGDATERAYRRGDALEKRRKLMEAWAAYVEKAPGGNVIKPSFGEARRAASMTAGGVGEGS
jgi:integrase